MSLERKLILRKENRAPAYSRGRKGTLGTMMLNSVSQEHPQCLSCDVVLNTRWCLRYSTAASKSLQSCPTLCDPIDGSPPGSPVPGILQERTLEWVTISFSNAWQWKVKVKSLSCVRLLATPWTAAYQAPPSMRFSKQEYWSGVPSPSLSDILIACISIEADLWWCYMEIAQNEIFWLK